MPPKTSILTQFSEKILLPIALPLDVVGTVTAVSTAFMQMMAPPWYQFIHHAANGNITYGLNMVILVSYVALLLACMYLVFPLSSRIDKRLKNVWRITDKKNRQMLGDRLNNIKVGINKLERLGYIMIGCMFIPVGLSRMFLIFGWQAGILDFVLSIAGLPVPILGYKIISSCDLEKEEQDQLEVAFDKGAGIQIGMFDKIVPNANGLLSRKHHAMLSAATQGDQQGMLDAISEDPEEKDWYSIEQLCMMLNVPTDMEGADYKRITNYVRREKTTNQKNCAQFIKKQGRAWRVGARAYGPMFATYRPSQTMIQLAR